MQPRLIDEDLYMMDAKYMGYEGFAAAFLVMSEEPFLIDSGASTSKRLIRKQIEAAGVKPKDIKHIFITHMHNDHFGGCPYIIEYMPEAIIYMSKESLEMNNNLTDRLDSEDKDELKLGSFYGRIKSVPKESVIPLDDGQTIELAGCSITAVSTPGHTDDHMSYCIKERNTMFVGDSLGYYVERKNLLIPTLYPPDLKPEPSEAMMKKTLGLETGKLAFSHFGLCKEPEEVLGEAHELILRIESAVCERVGRGEDVEGLPDLMMAAIGEGGLTGSERVALRMMMEHLIIGFFVREGGKYLKSKKSEAQVQNDK